MARVISNMISWYLMLCSNIFQFPLKFELTVKNCNSIWWISVRSFMNASRKRFCDGVVTLKMMICCHNKQERLLASETHTQSYTKTSVGEKDSVIRLDYYHFCDYFLLCSGPTLIQPVVLWFCVRLLWKRKAYVCTQVPQTHFICQVSSQLVNYVSI